MTDAAMLEAEAEPVDVDMEAEVERVIAEPDPAWWAYDMTPWDYLFPAIPF